MQENPYQSSRMRDKRRKEKKIKLILAIFIFAVLILGLIYITNASFLRIQQIVVNETEHANRVEVEDLIKTQLEGRYLGLFAKSNALIFSRSKISRAIKNNYSSIEKVDVDLKGLSTIDVELTEYISTALWCDVPVTPSNVSLYEGSESADSEEAQSIKSSAIPQVLNSFNNANCYFVNEDGVVFAKTEYDKSSEVIKTFGFIEVDPLKQSYANKKTFHNLIEFVKLLRRLNITADEIWTNDGEVYAIVTKERVKIYIDGEGDILEIFDNLETVIKRDAINQAQFANIDYIDLRFGNRVFYKLK
ncbi:MAG: hypothetical protein WC087_03355 [Candidatus Paceibacterota bacterium]